MKLRNKRTGEIGEPRIAYQEIYIDTENHMTYCYKTLRGVFEEWEVHEEPKGSALDLMILTLTNFIENEPDEDMVDLGDCKQMLENLKAWKRLKDKGFRFTGLGVDNYEIDDIKYEMKESPTTHDCQEMKDLKLLFGGEE